MLFHLTIKALKQNKKRTLVTILGIMFASALLFGIGLVVSTVRDNGIREAKINYGTHHITVEEITQIEKEKIAKQDHIKDIVYLSFIDQEIQSLPSEVIEQVEINLYGATREYQKQITLSSGRFAENDKEIIVPRNLFDNYELELNDTYKINEKEYTIVGVYTKSLYMQYHYYKNIYYEKYNIYTNYQDNNQLTAYITFDSTKSIPKQIANFTTSIDRTITYDKDEIRYENITLNSSLIDYYSPNLKGGTMAVLMLSVMVICSILGLFCIFVISNSFAISVAERTKLFGIMSSLGASRSQIKASVFIEAFLVGLIGIPLGFLMSLGLTGSVITIINQIMGEFITVSYQLAIYPLFILFSLLFIIFTIIISASRPAKLASLTSPIEAIRMNKNYNLNKRKLKSSKLIKKLFGIEGELAYLNLKRNKRKYKVTTISIVISIVLFLVLSTYINFGITESEKNINDNKNDYNISLYVTNHPKSNEFYSRLKGLPDIKEITSFKTTLFINNMDNSSNYTKEYQEYINSFNEESQKYVAQYLTIATIDEIKYQQILKKYHINSNTPVLINHNKFRQYSDETGNLMDIKEMSVFKDQANLKFHICNPRNLTMCYDTIENVYVTNDIFASNLSAPSLLVSDEMYQHIITQYLEPESQSFANDLRITIKSDSYKKLDDNIKQLIDEYSDMQISYENYNMQHYQSDMMFLTIKIVLYTVLSFIGLIAITSMFNTINTSMELRRGEFATLRSIGIEPTNFKKMILLESIFFGAKSLLYGLAISLLLLLGIEKIFDLSYGEYQLSLPFPGSYIVFIIIAVIAIITLTMFYSIRKMKHDNIIDTIRNESI